MRSYIALEVRRSLRDIKFVALVVGWPVGAYLLFAMVFGNSAASEGLSPKVGIMVAMACFGAIGAVLTATGPRLALERQIGWLRQLRVTPLTGQKVLAARVVSALVLTIPAIGLTFVTAAAVHDVRMPISAWIELGILTAIGSLPFAAVGLLIGCLADGDAAQGFSMVALLVLAALGGLWMPVSLLPPPMQTIAHLLPSNGLASIGWHIAAGEKFAFGGALVLAGWMVGAGALAALAARRLGVRG